MRHRAIQAFWTAYQRLPEHAQRLADRHFALLQADPHHPSLHFKRVGRLWSVRVSQSYRALAVETGGGDLIWFWIGSHADYDKMLR